MVECLLCHGSQAVLFDWMDEAQRHPKYFDTFKGNVNREYRIT